MQFSAKAAPAALMQAGRSSPAIPADPLSWPAAAPNPLPLPALERRMDRFFQSYPDGPITEGKTPGPGDIQLSTNDYLDLARDPRIIARQQGAVGAEGADVYMSGVYVQYLGAQRGFEQEMARFLGAEDAVLCQSGFSANEGLVQAIADTHTPVYLDYFAHASLFHGALAANAPLHVFRHNDAEHLRSLALRHGPGVVCVDAIYSTLGDECDLAGMIDVCRETGCLLVVDESHSIGVVGERGEGLVAAHGLLEQVAVRTFSLSKAFVGRGGIVAGPRRFTEYFRYESRPAIFSSAVMPWEIARFSATLEIIEREDWRRAQLKEAADFLRNGIQELGYKTGPSTTQIVPLIAGSESSTVRFRDALEANGVYGALFCAPATPRNKTLVRLCANVAVSRAELERVLAVFAKLRGDVDVDSWPTVGSVRRRRPQPPQSVPLRRAS